jgi:cytochrome c oxidase assembly protein Cox11
MTEKGREPVDTRSLRRRKMTTLALACAWIAVMVGLVAASPTLYRMFSAATGSAVGIPTQDDSMPPTAPITRSSHGRSTM